MITVTVYNTTTGRVAGTLGGSHLEFVTRNLKSGQNYLERSDVRARTQYIDVATGGVLNRPTLSFDTTSVTADDTDVATMTGLPDPCTVYVDGVAQEVTGGMLEFSADVAGDYEIEIRDADAFPAQAFKGTVTAT